MAILPLKRAHLLYMTEEGIDLISTHCLASGQRLEQLRELWPGLCLPDQVSKGRQVQRCFLPRARIKSATVRCSLCLIAHVVLFRDV